MARQRLQEFKSDHTNDVSGRGSFTPGGGENAPTAKKRRGDQEDGEKGMNKLDSKNNGLEPGKSAKGGRDVNRRPADLDGSFYEPMHKLDSRNSGLEQGKTAYSKDVGSDATKDAMPKLDSKSSGLEPHGYSEEVSPEEKLDAIAYRMAGLTEEEIDELYNTLLENEDEGEYEDDDEYEDELEPVEIETRPLVITKEDLDLTEALGSILDGDDLTEEFKTKAHDIFEAAVLTVVNSVLADRAGELEENAVAAVEYARQELIDTLDTYLDTVVEDWHEDNELALTQGIRTEVMESFVDGLKNLFAEHYVDIPEEKVDLIDEIEDRVVNLEDRLNNEIEKNIALKEELNSFKRASVVYEVCEDLTDLDAEKVREFAENVDFIDEDDFKKRVETIKENYFPGGEKKTSKEDVLDNLAVGEDSPNTEMDRIVQAINRSNRPFSDVRKS